MENFIENEGVEYPTPAVEQVEQEIEQQEAETTQEVGQSSEETDEQKIEQPTLEEKKEEDIVFLEDTPVMDTPTVDYTEIFGEEVKTKEDAKKYIETIKQASESVFANDTVKALNDYLKNGGSDEKNFLDTKHAQTAIKNNIEQLKTYDPIEAVKYDLKATHGLEDEEIEEYLSTKNAIDLKIEGNKIKNNWIGELNESLQQSIQQEVEMVKSVELRTQQFNQKVQSYIGELKAVDSIQVNESDKKMLATNLSNPNDFLRKHFPLDKNGLPTKEWVENAQRLLSRPRLASELKTKVNQAETNGGKKVFNNLHNIPTHEAALSSASSNNEKSVAKVILEGIKKAKEQEHYN